jgi:hypothetical protein
VGWKHVRLEGDDHLRLRTSDVLEQIQTVKCSTLTIR